MARTALDDAAALVVADVIQRTVAKRLEHIYGKSGVRNRTAAVAWARHPPVVTRF